jgi:putative RecB family exonuclease
MAVYSHSKLSTFEQCKYKYKLRYIDKIPSPVEKSIEAHLGTCVHDALEWMYKEVLKKRVPELDEVIEKYTNCWQEDYKENFLIVKKEFKPEDYFNKGVKFLIDYYLKHKPFNDGTLELEKRIWLNLDKNSPHKIIGFIDRLVYNKEEKKYEIHDYKTAQSLPDRNKFEEDRQLALYSIAIKQLFGEDKDVTLTWHYLSHNMRIDSRRTNEQLEKLKRDTLKLIHEIEETVDFPTNRSVLCDWCEYKDYCKEFENELPEEYREKQITLDLTKNAKENKFGDIEKEYPTASKYIKD